MWKAIHFQTKEVFYGSESEVLDLDNRIWKNKSPHFPEAPKSHNPVLNTKPLAHIRTYLKHHPQMFAMAGIWVCPIYSHTDLTTKKEKVDHD